MNTHYDDVIWTCMYPEEHYDDVIWTCMYPEEHYDDVTGSNTHLCIKCNISWCMYMYVYMSVLYVLVTY